MKNEKDRPQSDSLRTCGGVVRSAGFENFDVPIYASDEDINQIACMPLEQIKSELAWRGALNIPIPTRSALFKSLKVSSTYEAEPKQHKRAIWSLRRFKERGLAWLENKSSLTLRVRVCELVIASLLLIVTSGSALLLKPADNVTIPAPAMPDLSDMATSVPETSNDKSNHDSQHERPGTKALVMMKSPKPQVISDVTSSQRTLGRKRRIDTHTATKREAREPESTQHQLLAVSNLTRLVLEITQKDKQQEDILVSKIEIRQP